MLDVSEAAQIAKKHQLPLIVDAAAEEDLKKYVQLGADLVIYSGAKAIEGPSAGMVIGKNLCFMGSDAIKRNRTFYENRKRKISSVLSKQWKTI